MENPNCPLAPRSKRDTGKATAFFEAHCREKSNAMDSILSRRRQNPQAEGGAEDQNDKTVDGREEVKAFRGILQAHKFSWVS